MSPRDKLEGGRSDRSLAIIANGTIAALLLVFWALQAYSPLRYYAAVQEDGALEWATFWGFFLGCCAFLAAARRQAQSGAGIPWFTVGVALFCFMVAMEEISWGQRILGYRPPSYFLENNFQQEFNIHNILSSQLRELGVEGAIFLYGILLPVCSLVPALQKTIRRVGIVAPSPLLVPAFVLMLVFYVWYPWRYLAEVVEAMLGFGFLFAGLSTMDLFRAEGRERYASAAGSLVAVSAVAALALMSAAFSQRPRDARPGDIKAALLETKMLKKDLLDLEAEEGELQTSCGLHDRIFNFVWDYDAELLERGSFAGLVKRGLPQERADFFIDPWDTAYWVRDRCDEQTGDQVVFVYSFGPNRRRDSSQWRLQGDDVGVYVLGGPER